MLKIMPCRFTVTLLALMLSLWSPESRAQVAVPLPALKDSAKFPVGVALNVGNELGDLADIQESAALIHQQFNSIVAENGMKMRFLHPAINTYDFAAADALVSYARGHGMMMHGHTLIWHHDSQLPDWMKTYQGDWQAMLRDHVQQICRHFAGKLKSWDVVNEAIDNKLPDQYRATLFLDKLGPAYIEQAFIAAHEADPTAVLYYNDFGMEAKAEKLQFMLDMVDDFQRRQIPLHGIGFQMHVSIDSPNIAQIKSALQAVAARGLQVRISEMDVRLNQKQKAATLNPALAQQQKARYREIVSAYLQSVPPAQRGGITFWGLLDKDSWLVESKPYPDWPLLFDDQGQAKPAFWGVLEGLRESR
ncbi:endo-1,4-beta-xylanase [Undibacterium flavidum]|uniref:Beta-xylanase n=1 Tax=Undibacterium flavidum TaxID=2762297 RepID=A0ABR6Y8X8_9BURK|nr:endo-1,4-beta-xylanase [Undibacterium flavidum]MBC3872662.1 endo-1,4-beta-xylanase [Undibacterium flavidum]